MGKLEKQLENEQDLKEKNDHLKTKLDFTLKDKVNERKKRKRLEIPLMMRCYTDRIEDKTFEIKRFTQKSSFDP